MYASPFSLHIISLKKNCVKLFHILIINFNLFIFIQHISSVDGCFNLFGVEVTAFWSIQYILLYDFNFVNLQNMPSQTTKVYPNKFELRIELFFIRRSLESAYMLVYDGFQLEDGLQNFLHVHWISQAKRE